MADSINQVWDDIDAWLAQYAPLVASRLRPGVSDEAIAEAETALNLVFPADYKGSLRRHNGNASLNSSYEYLDLRRVVRAWKGLEECRSSGAFHGREIENGGNELIANTWWHPGWIPFAEDSCGNHFCIDTAPGPRGVIGQVFPWERSTGPEPRGPRSFLGWLTEYRDNLLAGDVYEVDEEGFIRRI